MKVTGQIVFISDEQPIKDDLSKKVFVVEYGNEYPRKAAFDCLGDRMAIIDNYKVNDRITVYFNIESRSYTRKDNTNGIITALVPWRIDRYESMQYQEATAVDNTEKAVSKKNNDLPF